MEDRGNLEGALETYRQALELARADPSLRSLAREIELTIQDVEKRAVARASSLRPPVQTPAPPPVSPLPLGEGPEVRAEPRRKSPWGWVAAGLIVFALLFAAIVYGVNLQQQQAAQATVMTIAWQEQATAEAQAAATTQARATATAQAQATATARAQATATPTALPINYAIRFAPDTAPQVVMFPPASNLNFGLDMTIEFWIRTTSTYGGISWYDSQWILDKDIEGGGNADWAITLRYGKIVFNNGTATGIWSDDEPLISVREVNDGVWHHVAIVRNVSMENGMTRIYIDGVLDASGTFATNSLSNTLALVLGAENVTYSPGLVHALEGDIDELRLWDIARSQSEIQRDMFILLDASEQPHLVGYWRFNEGTGQVARDQTLYHVDLQLGSSPDPDTEDPTWILAPELFSGGRR